MLKGDFHVHFSYDIYFHITYFRTKIAVTGFTKLRCCPVVWFPYGKQEADTISLFYQSLDVILKENLVVHSALQVSTYYNLYVVKKSIFR